MVHATRPGLAEEEHENLSRCLSTMLQQAVGIRHTVRRGCGRSSQAAHAAVALVEAVGHVMERLLDEHDRVYGVASDPMTRTYYASVGRGA